MYVVADEAVILGVGSPAPILLRESGKTPVRGDPDTTGIGSNGPDAIAYQDFEFLLRSRRDSISEDYHEKDREQADTIDIGFQ